MTQPNTPQGGNPVQVQDLPKSTVNHVVDLLQARINEVRPLLDAPIHKLSLIVIAGSGKDYLNTTINFPASEVPLEFQTFLHDYANRLGAHIQSLTHDIPLMRLGNHMVSLESLIKDYTAGEIPSIDADTAAALRAMQPGQTMTILINQIPHTVQRVS